MLRHRDMLSTCAHLVLAGLLASCAALDDATTEAAATGAADHPSRAGQGHAALVITEDGPVRGIATEATRAFLGIPYAAAPVGDLRWKPTQPHARWHAVLDATRYAPHCPQPAGAFGRATETEDCLFLNVFTPTERHERHDGRDHDNGRNDHDRHDGRDDHDRRDGRDDHGDHGNHGNHGDHGLRPVMVWIHGGALVTGESDDYDATQLVEQGDVLVVTINYRLGALGFLAHPALTAEAADHASGNYGLMDQQEALRWVSRNIARFGGDPSRVTIFGESAGGLSVHAHLASSGSHGLFQRAIVESGAYQLAQPELATGEAAGAAFAAAAGCAAQTAACLRGLSVAQVLAAASAGPGASPVIDHKVLTQSIGAAFATGQFNRVPVIEGSNHDEWRLFVGGAELVSGPGTAAGYPAAIQATLGVPAAVAAFLATQYPAASFPSPDLALSALGTDAIFTCNARAAAQLLSRFVPTFAYEFNDENAPQRFLPPVSFPYGAAHASEIQYLFDLPVAVPSPALDAAQQRLSAAMIDYWTTFARTGQPSSSGTPRWAGYQAASDTMQSLAPAEPRPETGFAADHKCALWDSLRP
jgi:para-nitrobenzyl esterase